MGISDLLLSTRALIHLRGYAPQRVTRGSLLAWLRQFPPQEHGNLLRLLLMLRVFREDEVAKALVNLNAQVLRALSTDGVEIDHVIYTSLDDAGSSSPVMLNLLRNHANLARRGAQFCDSHNALGMVELTKRIRVGAIVYVDDFAGTGRQFIRNRTRLAQYIQGDFSEFFLLPCVCEEALAAIPKHGVELRAAHVHALEERPLRKESTLLDGETRQRLLALAQQVSEQWPLGDRNLGTSVIFDRNVPNSTSPLLRGSLGQYPFVGVLPRWDDKPA